MRTPEIHRSSGWGRLASVMLGATLAMPACGPSLAHVWIDDLSPTIVAEAPSGEYVIGSGDMLAIRVYEQESVSTRGRVRPDGKLTIPLAGEVDTLGKRPTDLAKEIEARLKPFVRTPTVTVIIEESQPIRVSVLGEVAHPGVFVLEPGAGVLQALASAGGTNDYASRDRIFVIRRMPGEGPIRIRFSQSKLMGESRRAATFALVSGDVVMVE
jgi:polysaccharide export outer membrane protein